MQLFWHRLAIALGATVSELKDRIDAEELKYWMAYYAVEPFGEERADLRNAIVAQTVAACAAFRKGAVPKLEDFMPFCVKNNRKMDDIEMQQTLENYIKLTQGAT